ncbi:site-specific integrase, partial [Plesiomonas shigelloides]
MALVEQFLDAIWLERNLSESTLASYRHDINPLLARLARSNASLLRVSSLDLQALLAERVDQGYKASSTARLLRALRRLFQYLYREKLRADDPTALLLRPKLPQRLPKDLSEALAERLLAAPDPPLPPELRDKATPGRPYSRGLRVS